MTPEEKDLLIKDLCARLPYNVALNCTEDDDEKINFNCLLSPDIFKDLMSSNPNWIYKPYLRPLESMTEEEFQELHNICPHSTFNKTNDSGWIIGIDGSKYGRISRIDEISKLLDWLNKNMFDYRGLIPMGLALVAPEGMYKV